MYPIHLTCFPNPFSDFRNWSWAREAIRKVESASGKAEGSDEVFQVDQRFLFCARYDFINFLWAVLFPDLTSFRCFL